MDELEKNRIELGLLASITQKVIDHMQDGPEKRCVHTGMKEFCRQLGIQEVL